MNSLSIPVKEKMKENGQLMCIFKPWLIIYLKKINKIFKGKMNIHSTFRQKSKSNTKYKNEPLFDNELFYSTND